MSPILLTIAESNNHKDNVVKMKEYETKAISMSKESEEKLLVIEYQDTKE